MLKRKRKIICCYCGSDNAIKKGKRVNKNKEVQLYFCKECNRKFSQQNFKNKTYEIKTIINTLSIYNRGLTIDLVSEKTGIPRSTISNWQKEYRKLFTLLKYHQEIQLFNNNNNKIIEKQKYFHNLIYLYQQNSFKIERFIRNKEKGLYYYLQKVRKGEIDNTIFRNNNVRASNRKLDIIHSLNIKKTNNNCCKFTMMALELVQNNRERHNAIEKLLLENDSSTIAVEVPVFLQLSKSTIPWLKNIKSDNDFITGHIDILQYRNDKLYILDYKPGANKEKPIAQLFVYACCLSLATEISFNKIKLAWFDENVYYELGAMDVFKNVIKLFPYK